MKLTPSLPRATCLSDLVQRLSGLVGPGLVPVLAALALVVPSTAGVLNAQELVPVARLVAEPASLTMVAGTSAPMTVRALDAAGRAIPDAVVRVFGSRRAVAWSEGVVSAFQAGSHVLTATAAGAGGAPITLEIPVTVSWPAITSLQIEAQEGRLYTGTTMTHGVHGLHADGSERPNLEAGWESSNPSVASVDRFGNVRGLKPGSVTITARAGGATATRSHTVAANPATSLEITIGEPDLATGDVIHLTATTRRSNGQAVDDAPISWSYSYVADDSIAPAGIPGGAGIIQFGRFTGNYPGQYTLLARSGNQFAEKTLRVRPRDARRRISVTSRGSITNTHTSDLWPWTGKDGRDYALVGTWGADGYAFIFDITNLDDIVKTDSIQVNARTINDVTVSPDGRYGVLSREGASNRINGVVILDLANPAHPKIASTFDQELTGGVHNMFATNDHLFAVSGGAKYVIIDVKDIYAPKYVSEYRHPNARLHDLWVRDGIAYSAQGGAGTVVVDVGNGKYGGTIEKPKLITVYGVNSGHEIFPYVQQSTGKTYLFIGDEEMNRAGRVWEGTNYWGEMTTPGGVPQTSGGYVHIVDFTDPMNPMGVGRYHLEDFGAHDIIVEDDVLYHAYYEGGVRLVDVSGELLGNLADQNREIAVFKPYDPKGFTPNAAFVMNAMPWKGHVLFTDFNSGLWSARLQPKRELTP
ncbi:MAG: Ig-like domain-containing protein [Gemmatimonadota bacterium]